MLTEENFRLNMETAKRNALRDLGLSAPSSNLNYENRTRYLKRIAQEVTKYPKSFSPGQVETARRVLQTNYEPLESEGFSIGEFTAETVAQGKIVLPAFSGWALKIALAAVVVYLLFVAGVNRARLKND